MYSKNISCLVVGDGIKGMQNQSIALARAIGLQPSLIEVKPFWLTRLFPTLLAGRFSILYPTMIKTFSLVNQKYC